MVLTVAIILAFFIPGPWNIVVVCVGIAAEVGEVIWGRRLARKWRPRTGAEALVGMRAEVVSPLHPRGQVRANGELWQAVCEEGAEVGDSVLIKRLDGLTLVVEPAPPD